MKTLIVETDKLLADSLASALRRSGHQSLWKVDLQSALEVLDSDKPDLIILDLALAERSGAELLYEIRSYPEWQNLPVIIWSDLSEADSRPMIEGLKDLRISSYYHKSGSRLNNLLRSVNALAARA